MNRQERRKFYKRNKKKLGINWDEFNEKQIKQKPYIKMK